MKPDSTHGLTAWQQDLLRYPPRPFLKEGGFKSEVQPMDYAVVAAP